MKLKPFAVLKSLSVFNASLITFIALLAGICISSCQPVKTSGVKNSNSVENLVDATFRNSISLKKEAVENCIGGELRIVTIPQIGKTYEPFVYATVPKKAPEVFKYLSEKNQKPEILVNGSFFNEKTGVSTTFFKTTHLAQLSSPAKHNSQVYFPERACLGYSKTASQFLTVSSFLANSKTFFESSEASEVFCAGPTAIQKGENILAKSVCTEKFSAPCRHDKTDPISVNVSEARTSSCVVKQVSSSEKYPTMKIFQVSSGLWKCGLTLNELAERMKKEGCSEGMFHDGGNSSSLYLNTVNERGIFRGPALFERPVPIWFGFKLTL